MSELRFFNLLSVEDRDIMRQHFLSIGWQSQLYDNLYDAIAGSLDWERIKPDSPEYFYFGNLLSEAEELKKNEKIS